MGIDPRPFSLREMMWMQSGILNSLPGGYSVGGPIRGTHGMRLTAEAVGALADAFCGPNSPTYQIQPDGRMIRVAHD